MTQLGLLEWQPPQPAPKASVQDQQAARVGGRIDEAILRWCARHAGCDFHLSAMTADIVGEVQCAPDSPRRRLAALVAAGHVQAECIDRSRSMWRVAR